MDMRIDVQYCALGQLTFEVRRELRKMTAYPDSYMTSVIDDHPASARCWVARSKPRIVGWSLLRWFEPQVEAPHNAYVSVFVTPPARGRGIGRCLVRSAIVYGKQRGLQPCYYGATAGQRKFYLACGAPEQSITPHPFPRTYWAHCRFVRNRLRAN